MPRALLTGLLLAVAPNVFAAPPIAFDSWEFTDPNSINPVKSCPAGWTCTTLVSGYGFIQRPPAADGGPIIETISVDGSGGAGAPVLAVPDTGGIKRGPYAYLVNRNDNTVSVVDYSNLNAVGAEPLDVGLAPQSIAISPSGGYIYAGTGDGKIVIIRAYDRRKIGEISLGSTPASLVMGRDGIRLYVVVGGGKSIIVVDAAAQSVVKAMALPDDSDRLAIHPDGTRLYSLSHDSGKVHVIDTATGEVVRSHVLIDHGLSEDIALDASGGRLYITLGHLATTSTSLAVLDTTTNNISFPEISFAGLPQALASHPAAQQLFVTTESQQASNSAEIFGSVYIVDTNDMKLASILVVKDIVANVLVNQSGWLFGTNKRTNNLDLLDNKGQLLSRLPMAGLSSLVVGPELSSAITPGTKQLDFGEVTSVRPATRILTIANTGGLPLAVRGVRIEASNTSAAAVASSSGFAVAEDACTNKTLQPDDQCRITLSYAPVSTGQSNALVHIDSDSTLISAPVAMTARGVSGTAEASPSSVGGNSGGGGGSWGPVSLMVAVLWALVRRGRQRL